MQRIFAHHIFFGDKDYYYHVAQLADDGSLSFFPFEKEIHSTTFYSGTIRLSLDSITRRLSVEKLLSEESGSLEEVTER